MWMSTSPFSPTGTAIHDCVSMYRGLWEPVSKSPSITCSAPANGSSVESGGKTIGSPWKLLALIASCHKKHPIQLGGQLDTSKSTNQTRLCDPWLYTWLHTWLVRRTVLTHPNGSDMRQDFIVDSYCCHCCSGLLLCLGQHCSYALPVAVYLLIGQKESMFEQIGHVYILYQMHNAWDFRTNSFSKSQDQAKA